MLGGFADGTLRLFDLNHSPSGRRGSSDLSSGGEIMAHIQAKGLHTNLIMSLGITEDGRFCFGGVLRGSVEMVCVDLSNVESFYANAGKKKLANLSSLVRIFKHQDAKLKGFGSVTRLTDGRDTSNSSYRLFCGKGIKNIHIWSFTPPSPISPDPKWECIYDTQSNGMTVEYLSFRRGKEGLQGVSKSQGQCIRLWDLSVEEQHGERPASKRPPFVDVPNTENAVGVFGSYAFAGGHGVRVVDLDNDNPPFMVNDMEIPAPATSKVASSGGSSRRRAMRTVVTASGIHDGSRVLFELSDGNVLYYSSELAVIRSSPLCNLPDEWSMDRSDDRYVTNKITVNKVGSNGLMVVTTTNFNGRTGYGEIRTKILSEFDTTLVPSKGNAAPKATAGWDNKQERERKDNWGWMGVVPFDVKEKPVMEEESDEEKVPATPKTPKTSTTTKSTSKKRQSTERAEGGKRGRASAQVSDNVGDSVLVTPAQHSRRSSSGKASSSSSMSSSSSSTSTSTSNATTPHRAAPHASPKGTTAHSQRGMLSPSQSSGGYIQQSLSPSKLEAQINREVAEALAELRRQPQLTVVEPAGLYAYPQPSCHGSHSHPPIPQHHHSTASSKKQKNLDYVGPKTNFQSRFPNPPLPPSPTLDQTHNSERLSLLQDFHASYEIFMSQLAATTTRMKTARSLNANNIHYKTGIGLISRTPAVPDPTTAAMAAGGLGGTRQATVITTDYSSPPVTFQALQDIVEVRTARNMKVDEAISQQQDVLEELLARQRMEAAAVAARQGRQKGEKVSVVAVDFPFPNCFVDAKRDMTGN